MKDRQIVCERSYLQITKSDLNKLGEIAKQDRQEFFSRYPDRKAKDLCTALCQGAASHYVNGKNGVKDFDVWSFYLKTAAEKEYPPRRKKSKDFGKSKYGVRAQDKKKGYLGRRVDLLGRSIQLLGRESMIRALQRYLAEGRTTTSKALSQKAVVLIEPKTALGKIIWPRINKRFYGKPLRKIK